MKFAGYVTANAQTGKGRVRREVLEGRQHLVVPVGMLGEAVISGSKGAYFYPKEENAKEPEKWNGMPVVVYHPKIDGRHISARDPAVYNSRKVGVLMNASHTDKLMAEAWLDEERLKEVDVRVLESIEKEQPVETSTGLKADSDDTPGEFNGVKYKGRLSNYSPDHLAILPDDRGAFSVAMGGGLFANTADQDGACALVDELAMLVTNADRGGDEPKANALPDGTFPIETEADLKTAIKAARRARNQEEAIRHIKNRAKAIGLLSLIPDNWALIGNSSDDSVSYEDRMRAVSSALATTYGEKGRHWQGYCEAVYDSFVVFYDKGKYWKVAYAYKDGKVSLSGSPVEVVRTTDYRPIANSGGAPVNTENVQMNRDAHIATLIGNGWEESDRAFLNGLPDAQLAKIKPATAPVATPPAPASPPPPPAAAPVASAVTLATLVANADPATQQMFADMQASYTRERDTLVNKIKAHPANQFPEDALKGMAIPNLRAIAALVPDANQLTANGQQYDLSRPIPGVGAYAAAAGYAGGVYANDANDLSDPPLPPDLDFAPRKN